MTQTNGSETVDPKGLRVAISGAGSGIGLVVAQHLARLGSRVAICDSDPHRISSVAKMLPGILCISTDVSNDRQVEGFFSEVGRQFEGLDVLINNAGITGPTARVEDIDPAEWQRCLDVCLTGQFLCAHHAVGLIKAAGGGSIVNISSIAGKYGYAFRTPYASAKFGVIGLTQSLAKELGPFNIRVNAILPGIVEGDRMQRVICERAEAKGVTEDDIKNEFLAATSMRSMVGPQDVAQLIAFLISDSGRFISGQSIAVDGNVETL